MLHEINTMERMKLIYLALVFLNPVRNVKSSGESSGEYLRKAIFQLQEFNFPPPTNPYTRLPSNQDYKNVICTDKVPQNHEVQKINMNAQRNIQKYQNQSSQHSNVLPSKKIDQRVSDSEIYYKPDIPSFTKVREPEVLGFTRTELAALYKSALEKGSTMSLSTFNNALISDDPPQVTQTHVEFPVKQPLYQYYFFPLKTFVSELKKDHGHKMTPASTFDNTQAAQTTQTHLSNPLFVAISTFVTMAIIFMMSVLFLPKLTQLDILNRRAIQDDLVYLSDIVTNAIERSNFLDRFKDHVDSIR